MYFDRFDIVQAYYWWYADHYAGQGSCGFSRLSRIQDYYTPGARESGPGTENARAIYDNLCEQLCIDGCIKGVL